jgi:hypothetical protein
MTALTGTSPAQSHPKIRDRVGVGRPFRDQPRVFERLSCSSPRSRQHSLPLCSSLPYNDPLRSVIDSNSNAGEDAVMTALTGTSRRRTTLS